MDERHAIPLQTAINASVPGRKNLILSLYTEAEKLFRNQESNTKTFHRDRVTEKAQTRGGAEVVAVSATVTDHESGYYVQLNGSMTPDQSKTVEGPFLTFGKIFVQEVRNPQLQNTATKIWR